MDITITENILFFYKARIAFYAILKGMDIGPGDEVIIPGFTCVVIANAIKYLGANPVYVDIERETYNIDPAKIEVKISSKTKAIVAQHTFGIPCEMDKISEIAGKYKLFLVEDCCHALGSKYKGKEVGTFGVASFFSSQWSKPLTSGLGGWAVINNDRELANRIRKIWENCSSPTLVENLLLRSEYWLYSKLLRSSFFWYAQNLYRYLYFSGILIGSSSTGELLCEMPRNYEKKMGSWQKKILNQKFQFRKDYIEQKKKMIQIYCSLLGEKGIKSKNRDNDFEPILLRYPVLVENKKKILEKAEKSNIELGDWFISPLHPNLNGWDKVGYEKGMCPVSEWVCNHIINLPLYKRVQENDIKKIVDFIYPHIED